MSSTTTASTDSPTLPRWRSEFTATIAVMFEIPVSPPVNESNSRTRSASTSVNPSETMASPSPPRRAAGRGHHQPGDEAERRRHGEGDPERQAVRGR